MKPETNLFLRSLIGREKARLIAEKFRIVSGNCSRSPASLCFPPEDVDKIIQIDRDAKELNSALSELKEEAKKQGNPSPTPIEAPAAPHLSDDTANRIRKALGLYVDSLRKAAASVGELLQLLPDDKKLIQARFDAFRLIEQARQDLNEFNEAYPEKEE
jgi:hypothetical protein